MDAIDRDEKIVCITTGNGLKDPDAAIRASERPIEIECDMDILHSVITE